MLKKTRVKMKPTKMAPIRTVQIICSLWSMQKMSQLQLNIKNKKAVIKIAALNGAVPAKLKVFFKIKIKILKFKRKDRLLQALIYQIIFFHLLIQTIVIFFNLLKIKSHWSLGLLKVKIFSNLQQPNQSHYLLVIQPKQRATFSALIQTLTVYHPTIYILAHRYWTRNNNLKK